MKTKIFDIIAAARTGHKTVNEATNEVLFLFGVDITFKEKEETDFQYWLKAYFKEIEGEYCDENGDWFSVKKLREKYKEYVKNQP